MCICVKRCHIGSDWKRRDAFCILHIYIYIYIYCILCHLRAVDRSSQQHTLLCQPRLKSRLWLVIMHAAVRAPFPLRMVWVKHSNVSCWSKWGWIKPTVQCPSESLHHGLFTDRRLFPNSEAFVKQWMSLSQSDYRDIFLYICAVIMIWSPQHEICWMHCIRGRSACQG